MFFLIDNNNKMWFEIIFLTIFTLLISTFVIKPYAFLNLYKNKYHDKVLTYYFPVFGLRYKIQQSMKKFGVMHKQLRIEI